MKQMESNMNIYGTKSGLKKCNNINHTSTVTEQLLSVIGHNFAKNLIVWHFRRVCCFSFCHDRPIKNGFTFEAGWPWLWPLTLALTLTQGCSNFSVMGEQLLYCKWCFQWYAAPCHRLCRSADFLGCTDAHMHTVTNFRLLQISWWGHSCAQG